MDWRMDTGGYLQWVSPFRYLRIYGYLLLPEAFRSLSRLSSALSARASSLCSFLHDRLLLIMQAPSLLLSLAWLFRDGLFQGVLFPVFTDRIFL